MNQKSTVPWGIFLRVTAETMIAFYVMSFCLLFFLIHRPEHWILPLLAICALFLSVIIFCVRRVFKKLPLSAIMLIIPIAPLLALIIVVTLIPVIQYLKF